MSSSPVGFSRGATAAPSPWKLSWAMSLRCPGDCRGRPCRQSLPGPLSLRCRFCRGAVPPPGQSAAAERHARHAGPARYGLSGHLLPDGRCAAGRSRDVPLSIEACRMTQQRSWFRAFPPINWRRCCSPPAPPDVRSRTAGAGATWSTAPIAAGRRLGIASLRGSIAARHRAASAQLRTRIPADARIAARAGTARRTAILSG